jgi:hypothetical protein
MLRSKITMGAILAITALFAFDAWAVPVVYSAAGAGPADIQAAVDFFRADLGTLNSNVVGSFGTGRREINWDGVPDSFSAPNLLPANFFNVNSPRGVTFTTPGTGFQVSANAATATPIEFGNIDPSYPTLFRAFSAQRLFTALRSNITDVSFFVPGTTTAALTTGFGAVFTDVDLANITSLQFFDANNASLGLFMIPNFAGDETLSFLGVDFDAAVVSRVRITSGNQVLAPGNTANDVVVMDDFIFGEPIAAAVAMPEPTTLTVLSAGLLGLMFYHLRRLRRATKSLH